MLLVVDANVIFSAFIKESTTRELLLDSSIDLITPEFILTEIEKYSGEIERKANITKSEFTLLKNLFFSRIKIIPAVKLKPFLKQAQKISPDKKDAHYFALALKENTAIWSNDRKLKNQKAIKIFTTEEVNKKV